MKPIKLLPKYFIFFKEKHKDNSQRKIPHEQAKKEINLKKIRKRIDRIDNQIVDLLEKRLSLALETASFKDQLQDKKRETEILNRLAQRLDRYSYISCSLINKIYSLIFQESLKLQRIKSKENKINLSNKEITRNLRKEINHDSS